MERYTKVITPNTRPIAEGSTKANTNARPEGPKPAAEARPQGGSLANTSNGNSQGGSVASTNGGNSQGSGAQGSSNVENKQ
jgi:hypothetical protein